MNLKKIIREEFLKEFISEPEIALKKYLNRDDEEKILDLPYDFSYELNSFIEDEQPDLGELTSYFIELAEEDSFKAVDELEIKNKDVFIKFAEWLFKGMQKESLGGNLGEYPSWNYLSNASVIKNQWLIHFTSSRNAYNIYKNGFTKGVYDLTKLGLTKYLSHFDRDSEGYNFAYTIRDFEKYAKEKGEYKYGDTAIVFRGSGLRVWHYGDEEHQTIIWGQTAQNINIIEYRYGDWYIDSKKNGRILYKNEDLENVVNWFIKNYNQYRKNLNEQ